MIRINQLKLQIPHTEEALEKKIQKTLHLKKGDSFTYRIHRQSLDARRKPDWRRRGRYRRPFSI